jgi:hypothetical protein
MTPAVRDQVFAKSDAKDAKAALVEENKKESPKSKRKVYEVTCRIS